MHIISSSKSTVLSEFPELRTIFNYEHANNEASDFQLFSQKRLLVEVNKVAGLEMLQIKNNTPKQTIEISRVRKMKVENLYCVACQKQGNEEIALGLSNGQVKLLNFKTSEFNHVFQAETSRNSVVFLDYNASDEYMSAVYENGNINIYGIKTKALMESVNFDNNSTLARFHPVKRFHLSVASYKGSVLVYDIKTKRKVFSSLESHGAPCRDLCMSVAAPDTLISVGYDCLINVFDTRKRTLASQIRYCHPLSTVAISECGNFICVGNLKGELIAYDMRNTKTHLTSKKVHESAVVRIGFVPDKDFCQVPDSFFASSNGAISHTERRSVIPENVTSGRRDSFCEFLDYKANKGTDKLVGICSSRRESFDWDALNTRRVTLDDYRPTVASRFSLGSNESRENVDSISNEGKENEESDVENNSVHIGRKTNDGVPFKDRSNIESLRKLNNIQEEREEVDNDVKDVSGKDIEKHFLKLPDDKNSTPNQCKRNDIKKTVFDNPNSSIASNDILKEISLLRTEMNSRLTRIESDLNFNAEANKWQIFTQNFTLWKQATAQLEEVQDGLNIILQTDPFVNAYLQLKEENESLRQKILELSERK